MNRVSPTPSVSQKPSFREALRFWLKLGFISFGGPAGQIAIMHTELVERRKWISESRFLHALNYCMLLPGPEAQQLATYAGWLLHGTWGGIVAGTLFVLPSAILLWLLSYLYVTYGNIGWVAALFEGWKPAVLAIIVAATWRIGSRALKHPALWAIAAAAFVGIYFLRIPFPAIVFAALAFGYVTSRSASHWFQVPAHHGQTIETADSMDAWAEARSQPTLTRAFKVIAVCGALWWLPVLLLGGWLGWQSTLAREGVFFSKAAMMTFGGAYAVLPYVSQQAVEKHDWLEPHQMLDGLGFAETTPGPLIMVLQFVGFLGAWNHPGSLSPLVAATLGAAITTWTTFLPCFLWIFLGAPYIERLRANQRLSAAMTAVTAAVVGVILNLAVWFAGEVLWLSKPGVDWYGVIVASIAFIGLTRWKWGIIPVVLGAGLLGLVQHWWF